jgi:ectoine hydroxylase
MSSNGKTSAVGSAVIESFNREGYYLHRGLFAPEAIEEVHEWVAAQDPATLAKSWTEQEPGVQLAVFSVIHKGDHPVSRLANDPRMLDMAGELMGDPVYIWSSKMNMKAPWCGAAEYYHQDLVYWKDRGYPRDEMLSCMIFIDPHSLENAGLQVMPGTHRLGYVEHQPFININGLNKYMVPPQTLSSLYEDYGLITIDAEPGDVLFFHTSLIHGSSHNSSPQSRRIILSQLNTVGNEPLDVNSNAREFNLRRAQFELQEAERRYEFFKNKYEDQLASKELTFMMPVPDREKAPDRAPSKS